MSFSFSTTFCELGRGQVGLSKGKEISHQTHHHSLENEDSVDQPASSVTSSSFEHHNLESSCSSDRKDLLCHFQVPSASSSIDSSTEGDIIHTENSDRTKPAEESVGTG